MTPDQARDRLEELFKRAYTERPIATLATLDQIREAFEELLPPHPHWLEGMLALARVLAMTPEELAQRQHLRRLCKRAIELRPAHRINTVEDLRNYENVLAEMHAQLTADFVLALLGELIEEP